MATRVNDPVLVTGGAGFLGSHLCDCLMAAGHEVTALDDLSTGSLTNLRHLIGRPGFSFVRHDVTEAYDLRASALYNLACPASPEHYQRRPVQTLRTCVLGAMHAADLACSLEIPVLQASTSEVYGDPTEHPQRESYTGSVNPVGPRACYDEGKRAAEALLVDYHRQDGARVRIARIFNTYGPRMALGDGRVVPNFILQALRGEPLTVYGDGMQTRSLCYVDDLLGGLVALAQRPCFDGPVNLGNPCEVTMLELAEEVLHLVGGHSKIAHAPLPADDPKRRRPDITKARDLLGFAPRVSLRDGLARTVADVRGRL